ncbi:MAG: urease accessory protein UreD [Thermoleophilaceae bacterium]
MIAERRFQSPLGSVRASYPDSSGTAVVVTTHPAGGVLGGDQLDVGVELAEDARATLLDQGATQAYRGSPACRQTVLRVADGAVLEHLPHHVIPFAGSSLALETRFELDAGGTLIAWDALAAGRVARGERFAFERLSSRTVLLRDGMPLVRDGVDLDGGGEPFGGFSYLGAMYVAAPVDMAPLADGIHTALAGDRRVLASASAPVEGVCVVRILCDGAPELYRSLERARALARGELGLVEAPPIA